MIESKNAQKIVAELKKKKSPKTTHKRILIVDDDELVLDSVSIILKRNGYEIETAKNGFDALECLDVEEYALIVCDIRMPGITGVEVIKSMRRTCKIEVNKEIPVIFITGYYEHDIEKETRDMKLLDCIHKPFGDSQILQMIKIHLGY